MPYLIPGAVLLYVQATRAPCIPCLEHRLTLDVVSASWYVGQHTLYCMNGWLAFVNGVFVDGVFGGGDFIQSILNPPPTEPTQPATLEKSTQNIYTSNTCSNAVAKLEDS